MYARYRVSSLSVSVAICSCLCLLPSVIPIDANADALDSPSLTLGNTGMGKQALVVTAGPSGTPAGFTVLWMKGSEYYANGSTWPEPGDPRLGEAHFWGAPELNVFPGECSIFGLPPDASITVELGDLFDESGVTTSTTDELEPGTGYVFCAWANGDGESAPSALSSVRWRTTLDQMNCTFTQGYWKNHPSAWPVTSLTVGTVVYTQAELLSILGQSVRGNGLVSLAHQLIAAKLNVANGADPSVISATIAVVDALIGGLVVPPVGSGFLSPSSTSSYTQVLDDYNNGIIGPGHCAPGACCLPGGSCQSLEPQDCAAMGGVFQSPGSSCSPDPCRPAAGSCCFADGTCAVLTEAECFANPNAVAWHAGIECPPDPGELCVPVAAERTSWGQVKRLQR